MSAARNRKGPPPEPEPEGEPRLTFPHDLDAERAILGAILIDNSAYARVESLRADHFFRRAHQRIYTALASLLDVPRGAADWLTLRAALGAELDDVGGATYLASLVDGVPRATNISYYAGIVMGHAKRRALIREASTLMTLAYEAQESAEELLARADLAMMRLRHGADDGSMLSLAQSHSALVADLAYRFEHRGELMGVPTGFESIDAFTGGWRAGDMDIIAARPSIGKTTFVMQSASAAAESFRRDGTQRRVAIFSLEMKRLQLEYRILSMLSGVPVTLLESGWVPDHASAQWEAISTAQERMVAMNLHIDDSSTQTVGQIRGKCRRLMAEGGLDEVVIDYAQLLTGELQRKGATANEQMTHTSRSLKQLAGDLGCPVLVLSQLNRASTARIDPRPKMQDLRESGSLEQDADKVIFLHRNKHKESGPTEFIIEKSRNGPTGTLVITIERDTTRFQDGGTMPDDTAEKAEQQKMFARQKAIAKKSTVRI